MKRARVLVSLVLAAGLAGCSLLGDDTKTTVTLSVGGDADHHAVETILRNRVTGAGMPKPGFVWKAKELVMTVPGDHHDADFGKLTAPGVLEFRKVLDTQANGTECVGQPTAAETELMTACNDQKERFELDVAKVVRTDVASAEYQRDDSGQNVVLVKFTSAGQAKFTALTQEAVGNAGTVQCEQEALGSNGNCLVAVVLDGRVVSAPEIMSVLTGDVLISGSFSATEAKQLAALLDTEALPVAISVTGVATA
ncbi:MAG: hypothetical protein HOU81_01065 [Hamadaea sp.]|uniref:SecDF P1 head subdomain-containing protein n=1 Tax=Hamadaea sp. TaxID=2024425 RepID=UPI0017D97F24|nr:hypothetical protein [Hamadaea sp.]NUR69388.1 hypothetical protein [Hamadaea sp.]NUT23205.1 hypothetical protein [Hamadaea sp.]